MELLKAALLGIVEGLTEFLPVSSTGHLLVASAILKFPADKALRDSFDIFIQLGAVLAVVVYYRKYLLGLLRKAGSGETKKMAANLFLSFLPAGLLGLIFHPAIKGLLFTPAVVAASLAAGGVVLLLVRQKGKGRVEKLGGMQALAIGLAQAAALVPGISRSAASIIGGLAVGMRREEATRYSFLLAIPTLGMATVYELLSAVKEGVISSANVPALAVGTAVSFLVALLAIDFLLKFVSRNDFRGFGWYRIAAGAAIGGLLLAGML